MRALVLSILILGGPLAAAKSESVTGFWKTFDEKTNEPKGLVEITEAGGVFRGVLRETYKKDAKVLCDVCPGDKKDKPYKGLEIIWDVKSTGAGEWGDGRILDPENGKTYRVKFALQKDGEELKVRGYLGISLLGRTQVWTRMPNPKPI